MEYRKDVCIVPCKYVYRNCKMYAIYVNIINTVFNWFNA